MLLTLRVYAITLRNKTFLCVALVLVLVRAGVDIWARRPYHLLGAWQSAQSSLSSQRIPTVVGRSTTGDQFGAFSMCEEIPLSNEDTDR